VAKKIVDGDYDPLQEGENYSKLLIGVIKKCMTANPKQRPNTVELCQLMVPVLMQQIDDLRGKEFKNQQEIKYLRERLRLFEGTSASGFKGFSGAQNLMMT